MTHTASTHEGQTPLAQRISLQIPLIVTSGLKFQPGYEFEGYPETTKGAEMMYAVCMVQHFRTHIKCVQPVSQHSNKVLNGTVMRWNVQYEGDGACNKSRSAGPLRAAQAMCPRLHHLPLDEGTLLYLL